MPSFGGNPRPAPPPRRPAPVVSARGDVGASQPHGTAQLAPASPIQALAHAIVATGTGVAQVAHTARAAPKVNSRLAAAIAEAQVIRKYMSPGKSLSPRDLLTPGGPFSGQGTRFPSFNSLPPKVQIPIIKQALAQAGLGQLPWDQGVAHLYKTLGPDDQAGIREMQKAIAFQKTRPSAPPPLIQGPQGGFLAPANQPDTAPRNLGGKGLNGWPDVRERPIPLASPRSRRYSPIPTKRWYQTPKLV